MTRSTHISTEKMEGEKMYYIIETNYVGPNHDQHMDDDDIRISTVPARGNSTGEVITEGWCGTTNDRAVYAHGGHESVDAAKAAIAKKFGYVRYEDANGDDFLTHHYGDIVAVCKPGKYEQMSRQGTADWAHESIQSDITAETTDEKLAELLEDYAWEANDQGYQPHSDLIDFMTDHRDGLLQEEVER